MESTTSGGGGGRGGRHARYGLDSSGQKWLDSAHCRRSRLAGLISHLPGLCIYGDCRSSTVEMDASLI